MKKTIFLMLVSLFIGGCGGIGCKDAPPRKAEFIEGGGYGMAYHFKLYDVGGDAGHTPSPKCINYYYITSDIYTDTLGTVNANDIIWIDSTGRNAYPDDQGPITLFLSKKEVRVNGFDYTGDNGTYPIK